MESFGAPILRSFSFFDDLGLYASKSVGKGVIDILNMPATYESGSFWKVFLPVLTANIGFWATMALNIPDFSRFAKTSKKSIHGSVLGLPASMTAFSFVGVFVTGATNVAFGEMLWDRLLSSVKSTVRLPDY